LAVQTLKDFRANQGGVYLSSLPIIAINWLDDRSSANGLRKNNLEA
jgi:hypothetical protein